MVTLTLEHAPEALRGRINKYLNEIRPFMFIGNISSKVADEVWKIIISTDDISAVMTLPASNEQGYTTRIHGYPSYKICDFDGITVMSKNYDKNKELYDILWAKTNPYKSLISHMIETGYTAYYMMKYGMFKPMVEQMSNIMKEDFNDILHFLSFICALHDIGKAHPAFQYKSEAARNSLSNISLYDSQLQTDGFRHEQYIETP